MGPKKTTKKKPTKPKKTTKKKPVVKVTFKFEFNGCCRGDLAKTNKKVGKMNHIQCKQRCTSDKKCNAVEVNGCKKSNLCVGDCYLFYGDANGKLTNGKCVTNGDQKCYSKQISKPKPAIKDFGANAHSRPGTLKLCQGDCDQDSQCDKGLKCFQRSGQKAVPGCGGPGVYNHDYCIKAPKPAIKDFGANAHSRPGTLKLCQGDCDQDSQCDKGLKCFQRSGTTAVPGCTGKGVTNHDYCIKPTVKPTKPKKTTKKKPTKPKKTTKKKPVVKVTFKFEFNGCCRGDLAKTNKKVGKMNHIQCKQRCTSDKKCNAVEVNGCKKSNLCVGDCYLFYGDAKGKLTNGKCVTNGDQKCYSKQISKPKPAIKDFGANAHTRPGTLKLCQGDCDQDSQCDKGL